MKEHEDCNVIFNVETTAVLISSKEHGVSQGEVLHHFTFNFTKKLYSFKEKVKRECNARSPKDHLHRSVLQQMYLNRAQGTRQRFTSAARAVKSEWILSCEGDWVGYLVSGELRLPGSIVCLALFRENTRLNYNKSHMLNGGGQLRINISERLFTSTLISINRADLTQVWELREHLVTKNISTRRLTGLTGEWRCQKV